MIGAVEVSSNVMQLLNEEIAALSLSLITADKKVFADYDKV
jgi:hypothetical protein